MPRSRKANRVVAPDGLRRRWRVALADAETSEKAWAEDRDLSANHVREVVLGIRKSDQVLRAVIDFVRIREKQIAKRIAADPIAA